MQHTTTWLGHVRILYDIRYQPACHALSSHRGHGRGDRKPAFSDSLRSRAPYIRPLHSRGGAGGRCLYRCHLLQRLEGVTAKKWRGTKTKKRLVCCEDKTFLCLPGWFRGYRMGHISTSPGTLIFSCVSMSMSISIPTFRAVGGRADKSCRGAEHIKYTSVNDSHDLLHKSKNRSFRTVRFKIKNFREEATAVVSYEIEMHKTRTCIRIHI